MSDEGIHVPYNRELQPLEKLLSSVRRPGDFFVDATFDTAMPRVEIDGAGVLSFPVPEAQIRQIIEQASRAPFGRGEETILDESVRKVWQLPPEKVRLGGKTWEKTFRQILDAVTDGLGCGEADVAAELYKLLVYDEGGFFKAHRDTEKADGMFGTMIVVLPAAHRGGELIIRHAGREVTLDLSSDEVSELRVAAFYADCEHEVMPVTTGYRVCLVYNLIQKSVGKRTRRLSAPDYHTQMEAASRMLRETFAQEEAPAKLAWLFKHAYSPAGLSFAGLKGEDVALAKVLRRAAEAADCAVHLGIVHIEETGLAEPDYSDVYNSWGYRGDTDPEDADFEVVDVSDFTWHVGEWHNTEDRPVDFGDLPLEEGEVLPAGALDDVKPDKQRVLEATGNEGATFERSYHRAALVIWPRDRFAEVLLQAGPAAVLPYLAERVTAYGDAAGTAAAAATAKERKALASIARRTIKVWEDAQSHDAFAPPEKRADRGMMIDLLVLLEDAPLLERFLEGVVTRLYDGSEIEAIVSAAAVLDSEAAARLLPGLVAQRIFDFPRAVLQLFSSLIGGLEETERKRLQEGLIAMAEAIVAALPKLKPTPNPLRPFRGFDRFGQMLVAVERVSLPDNEDEDEDEEPDAGSVDAGAVAGLLEGLRRLGADELRTRSVTAIAGNPAVFDPVTVVAPALKLWHSPHHKNQTLTDDADAARLWQHTAEFLLARSEQPPSPPADWKQDAAIPSHCADCRELQAFVSSRVEKVHRFRINQSRRQHLHQIIEKHGLDMTHVTERKGSPQTLVCTKTLATFERQCALHKADTAAMTILLKIAPRPGGELGNVADRMSAAKQRKPQPFVEPSSGAGS